LMFTPDCKVLAAKGADQIIRLFNAETVKELHKLGEGEGALGPNAGFVLLGGSDAQGMSISPNGKTIATGSGNTIRTWDVETGKEKPLPAGGHRGPVSSLGVSADGKTLISRGADRVVRRWDLATGEELGNFVEPLSTYSFAVAPDGNTVAFGGTDATIRLHDAITGKSIKDLKGHPAGTAGVLFSPDGKLIASYSANDNTIRTHDVAKGTQVQQMVLQTSGVANPGGGFGRVGNVFTLKLAFSADSRTVIAQATPMVTSFRVVNNQIEPAAGDPGSLKMWDVATGKEIRNIALSNQHGRGTIAISPDGRLVATETADQTISVWEIASGKQRSRLGQPEVAAKQANVAMAGFINVGGNIAMLGGRVVNGNTVAFSPDGTLLACKNTDHSIRVYDVVSGKEIGRFKGHQGPVSALAFTADGKRLATGSSDTTLLVWDVAGLKREPTPSPLELKAEEVADGWRELVGDDGEKALTAILKLSRGPKQTVPFLREQIKPAVPADPKKVAKLIADLDSEDFQERSGAVEELERLGDLAMPALQKALTGQPTLETRRRIEPLVAKLTGGVLNAEQIRVVRAIEALEKANSPEARQLLQSLAAGAPGALPTRETQKVLDRSPK